MATGVSSWLSPPCPVDYMAEGKRALLSLSVENKQRLSESEQSQDCKLMLVEKNRLGFKVAEGRGRQDVIHVQVAVSTTLSKPRLTKPLAHNACAQQKQSAFTELAHLQESCWAQESKAPQASVGQLGSHKMTPDVPRTPAGGTVCSVWPGAARGEQRSAFHKPVQRPVEQPGCFTMLPAEGSAEGSGELSGLHTTGDIPCWAQPSTAKLLGDFWNLRMLSQNILPCSTFQGGSRAWMKLTQIPPHSAPSTTASPALLPPTLSSLGLFTQNWCAKCSLAFCLTADLVFHMRAHHKRENVGSDPHSKKRRVEALTCPVCHEYFQERHHLSRHMTSHS